MNTPLITVLIDAFNYGHFIEQAVDSVLAQDFPREQREILVIDDGSTDDTAERLKKYGDAIRYLRKTNGGQASAFNFGFEHARGDVIALLDADDLWLPEKLRRISEVFEQNPEAGMVYHRTHLWTEGGKFEEDSYFVEISGRVPESRASLLRYAMVGTSCLAFRRSALNNLLPVPDALRSQADAYLTALIVFVAPVFALPEFLAKYRIHGSNLFQTSADGPLRSALQNRITMRQALASEIRAWLERNLYDLNSRDLRAYLKQWTKAQEVDQFRLRAPGRWTYFRHLFEYPRVYREIMSPRHRLYSTVRAFSALILGYHHLHLLDDFRRGYKELFSQVLRVGLSSEERKHAAAKS